MGRRNTNTSSCFYFPQIFCHDCFMLTYQIPPLEQYLFIPHAYIIPLYYLVKVCFGSHIYHFNQYNLFLFWFYLYFIKYISMINEMHIFVLCRIYYIILICSLRIEYLWKHIKNWPTTHIPRKFFMTWAHFPNSLYPSPS